MHSFANIPQSTVKVFLKFFLKNLNFKSKPLIYNLERTLFCLCRSVFSRKFNVARCRTKTLYKGLYNATRDLRKEPFLQNVSTHLFIALSCLYILSGTLSALHLVSLLAYYCLSPKDLCQFYVVKDFMSP